MLSTERNYIEKSTPPRFDSLPYNNGMKLIEPKIKVINFLLSGSKSIELLFRYLPSQEIEAFI